MFHILLGDDDDALTSGLAEYLEALGLNAETASDGKAILKRMHEGGIDLLVLDIMMPEMDGIEVLKALRTFSEVPVIMYTAKDDTDDRILGLSLGADDYLPKPIQSEELALRIKAILRRAQTTPTTHNARLMMNGDTRQCTIDGKELLLTGSEFDMLNLLLENAGEIVSKDTLSIEILGRKLLPFDRSVDVHISRLRKKLQLHTQEAIKSIRGKGYQLVI